MPKSLAASGRKLQAESFADPRLIYEAEEARSLNPSRFGDQKMGVSQSFELFGKVMMESLKRWPRVM